MTNFGLVMVAVVVMMAKGSQGQTRGGICQTQDGSQGFCIAIRDCEPLRTLLGQIRAGLAPVGSVEVLRKAICLFDNNEPLVCCSVSPATPRPSLPTNTPRVGSAVLPERCGINGLTDRIIDGAPAPLRAWPWMAILRGNTGRRSSWFCGGTLISDRFVLTAAHCFKEQLGVNLEYARIGEHNLRQAQDCEFGVCAPPPQDIPVERIIRHPSYGSPCNECNDIALLKLSRPAVLHTLYVMPICLPLDPIKEMGFSVQEFKGKSGWAAGWGTTARDPTVNRRPAILQQVQLPIQDLSYCDFLKRSYPDQSMVICAGGEGKDTCRGDSGGPLTLTNSVSTRHFLIGVTSLGPTVCGSQETQGLYTSVHHYIPWITSTMRT